MLIREIVTPLLLSIRKALGVMGHDSHWFKQFSLAATINPLQFSWLGNNHNLHQFNPKVKPLAQNATIWAHMTPYGPIWFHRDLRYCSLHYIHICLVVGAHMAPYGPIWIDMPGLCDFL